MDINFPKQPKTIQLTTPICIDGQSIEELTVRLPKVKDMLAAEKSTGTDADKTIFLIALLTNQSPKAIHELDLSDFNALKSVYESFLD